MISDTQGIAGGVVRSIYDRWERLEAEKKALADDLKDLFAEAKSAGFDTKLMRKAFALHKAKEERPAEVEEAEAIIDLYLAALDAPRVGARPAHAREERAKARMSESMQDHKELVMEIAEAGLISPEAAEETFRLADAIAAKFGNGPLDHDPITGEIIEDRGAPGSAPVASSPGTEADADPEPIHEPEVTKPSGAGQATAAALESPAAAMISDQGASADAPAGMQDRCVSTPAPISILATPGEAESREDIEGRGIPIASEVDADDQVGGTAAPITTIADAKLISRVLAAKRKGLSTMDAGDSARWQSMARRGVLIHAAGRLFHPSFAPAREDA